MMKSLKILRSLHGRPVSLKSSSSLFGHERLPSSLPASSLHSSVLLMQYRNGENVMATLSSSPPPPPAPVPMEQPAHESDSASASDNLVLLDEVFEVYKARTSRGVLVNCCIETLEKLHEIYETLYPRGVSLSKTQSYYARRRKFLDSLVEHPVFLQVISDILEHRSQFSSESLTSILWLLNCLEVRMKSKYPQEIIEELLPRKNTFSLQALSNFYRCMRGESIYGYMRIAECFPLLDSFLNGPISTESEFRLLTECVHRSLRILPESLIKKYLQHVHEYCQKLPFQLEDATLCLMINTIYEAQHLPWTVGNYISFGGETIYMPQLIREVCYALEPRIPGLDETNMISLSKFLHFSIEPPSFLKKAYDRAWELVTPNRLDLMTIGNPRTHSERMRLLEALNHFLDECSYFGPVAHIVYRVLRKAGYDPLVYDKYFSKVQEMLEQESQLQDESEQQLAYSNEEDEQYLEDEFLSDGGYKLLDSVLKRKLLVQAHEYIILRMRYRKPYTHPEYEREMQGMILDLIASHKDGDAILVPKDYAKAIAFLLATDYEPVELDPHFLENLDIQDLILITKGAELGTTDCSSVLSAVCRKSELFFRDDLKPWELIGLAKINSLSQRLLYSNPIYPACIESLVKNTSWSDSRTAKELMQSLCATDFNYPPALERVSKFLIQFEHEVSSACAVSFLIASFLCGAEDLEEAMPVCARIVERDFDEMHPFRVVDCALALCYHGALNKRLIDRIFCVSFLGQVDNYFKSSYLTVRDSLKIRNTFMALNRAVCMEEPGANVPWFHQRYCQEVAAVGGFYVNVTLHEEVSQILEERLGQEYFTRNSFSPYYYHIDFVVHLSKDGEPVKIPSNSSRQDAASKVAVIVQRRKDYTTNVRQLKGHHLLKNRHLEMMGYRVVNVNPWTWYSLEMSDRQSKVEHLKSCILKQA